jgi:hypothetical protein
MMAVRLPLVTAPYHRDAPDSGDISVLQQGQLHATQSVSSVEDRLAVEKDHDAVIAQTPETPAGHDVASATPTDGADVAPPATAMAHAVALSANYRAVSHFSLSTLRDGSLESRYD